MNEIETLIKEIVAFRDARDWAQFHNGKDLSLALSIEAAELNELFLWKKAEEVDVERLKEELADVMTYALLLAHKFQLEPGQIIREKLEKSGEKYPIEKARGSALKYTEFEK